MCTTHKMLSFPAKIKTIFYEIAFQCRTKYIARNPIFVAFISFLQSIAGIVIA